jgi:hypothetical protein
MSSQPPTRYNLIKVLRWTARIWSALSIAVLSGFVVGEGVSLKKQYEVVGFLLFPVGISVGMFLGWWKERLGGSITVASLLIFYCLHFATVGEFPHGLAWLVFSFPGFLFLLLAGKPRTMAAG